MTGQICESVVEAWRDLPQGTEYEGGGGPATAAATHVAPVRTVFLAYLLAAGRREAP